MLNGNKHLPPCGLNFLPFIAGSFMSPCIDGSNRAVTGSLRHLKTAAHVSTCHECIYHAARNGQRSHISMLRTCNKSWTWITAVPFDWQCIRYASASEWGMESAPHLQGLPFEVESEPSTTLCLRLLRTLPRSGELSCFTSVRFCTGGRTSFIAITSQCCKSVLSITK